MLFVSAARADVSLFVLESVGVAGEFTGSGHTAVYFSNICADGPTRLRLCNEGESGAVVGAYPGMIPNVAQEWIAVPVNAYLYGVDDLQNVPLYANGKVRSLLRDNYRKQQLRSLIPDNPDGTMPAGRWAAMLSMALNRDIYSFNLKTTREEDAKFLQSFNSMPPMKKFNSFSRNCADFTKKIMNSYFPGATQRDVINDFGITTPKALARSLTGYADSKHERLFHLTKYSQVHGTIWKSHDNRNFTEKALLSKKYIVPAVVFYPPIVAVFAGAYLTTGNYTVNETYEKYASPEIARLNLEKRNIKASGKRGADVKKARKEIELRKDFERAKLFANEGVWNRYKGDFRLIVKRSIEQRLFQNEGEIKTFFKDLETKSTPALDESGAAYLNVRYYDSDRILGLTRRNILDPRSDRELALKLIIARIYAELNAKQKDRGPFDEFQADWALLQRLKPVNSPSGEALQARAGRGKFVTDRPEPSFGRKLTKLFINITQ